MKILVTGVNGYIGANLANYIVENYEENVYVIGIYNEYNEYLNPKVTFIEK